MKASLKKLVAIPLIAASLILIGASSASALGDPNWRQACSNGVTKTGPNVASSGNDTSFTFHVTKNTLNCAFAVQVTETSYISGVKYVDTYTGSSKHGTGSFTWSGNSTGVTFSNIILAVVSR